MDSQSRPPFSMPDDLSAESQRVRRRDSLFLAGRLKLDGERAAREVRVRNLSAGGMMIEVDSPVAMGRRLTVELRGIGEVEGHVAWYAEGRIGVALDTPIDPQLARKPVGGGARTPTYAKSFFG